MKTHKNVVNGSIMPIPTNNDEIDELEDTVLDAENYEYRINSYYPPNNINLEQSTSFYHVHLNILFLRIYGLLEGHLNGFELFQNFIKIYLFSKIFLKFSRLVGLSCGGGGGCIDKFNFTTVVNMEAFMEMKWIVILLSIFSHLLLAVPLENYENLQEEYHLPSKCVLNLFFLMQMLFSLKSINQK